MLAKSELNFFFVSALTDLTIDCADNGQKIVFFHAFNKSFH